jgi:hypothetical protein
MISLMKFLKKYSSGEAEKTGLTDAEILKLLEQCKFILTTVNGDKYVKVDDMLKYLVVLKKAIPSQKKTLAFAAYPLVCIELTTPFDEENTEEIKN